MAEDDDDAAAVVAPERASASSRAFCRIAFLLSRAAARASTADSAWAGGGVASGRTGDDERATVAARRAEASCLREFFC